MWNSCEIHVEIEESYISESGSKLDVSVNVSGIHNLKLNESEYELTYTIYFSRNLSASDLKLATINSGQLPSVNGHLKNNLTNNTPFNWEGIINTDDRKYLTVISKINNSASNEIIIQNCQQFEINWRGNPNQKLEPTVKTPVE